MLLLLSPSKTLDETSPLPAITPTQPDFLEESKALVKILRQYDVKKLRKLMDVSEKIATLNVARYQQFKTPFTAKNARPALLTFKGDVYDGMEVEHYTKKDFAFAQKHLRMLSGLYGLLRPLDLMQPYRLEMGTMLKNPRGKQLYAFWGNRITDALNALKPTLIVNLASEEYFKAVQPARLKAPLVQVVFKDFSGGKFKVIGLFAKKARGMMANWVIREKLEKIDQLKAFSTAGYRFDTAQSEPDRFVFTRKAKP